MVGEPYEYGKNHAAQDCSQKMFITNLIPSFGPNGLLVGLCAARFHLANNIFTLEEHLI